MNLIKMTYTIKMRKLKTVIDLLHVIAQNLMPGPEDRNIFR